jgi:hypothetical protein
MKGKETRKDKHTENKGVAWIDKTSKKGQVSDALTFAEPNKLKKGKK